MMRKRHSHEEEDGMNFWGSGLHGNQEEYERYLLIKRQLEGDGRSAGLGKREKRGTSGRGRPSLLRHYPAMKWAMLLLLIVNATEILGAYGEKSFIWSALYWSVVSFAIFWYFALRDAGDGAIAILDHFMPDMPASHSLTLWGFLLGCPLSTMSPHSFARAWVSPLAALARWIDPAVQWDTTVAQTLPRMPLLLQLIGSLLVMTCGGLIFLDVVAFRWLKGAGGVGEGF
ncbi:MAG: hypothetical protein LBQ90_01880 [Synergistaceae bacterium]|nr:hypothetical protein [Synergistaceae bacterium]